MTSKVQIYSYSACSTCRKAISWLLENNIEYELIDIVKNPPGERLLVQALKQFDDRKKLFNTNGASYRAIGAKVVKEMSDLDAIKALASDGKLIKRPFLITEEGKILLGFRFEDWNEALIC